MFLTLAFSLTLAADPAPPPRLVGELWELKTDTGTLHGTLDLPDGPGPWPAVVLHPGSGPTDRNGNNPIMRNDSLKMLGRALVARGIAVLRIDKRGIAASANGMKREEDARLEVYADDLTAWIALLRKDSRFTRIGVIGHSEGSLIALVAAKDAKPDAIVSLCGPGRPFGEVVREQLKAGKLPKDLYDASDKILTELEAGRPVEDVPPTLKAFFRPSVQPYLISLLKPDPVKLAAEYRGPLLVVSGTTDIQVPVSDGARLAQAKPGTRHAEMKEMNHILKRVPQADRSAQIPTYSDPSLPLHPELADELAGFLKPALRK